MELHFMKKIKLRLFLFLVGVLFHLNSVGNTFKNFLAEKNIHSKSNKALILWERYTANSIDSLNLLGIELYKSAGSAKSNYGIAISKRILGCYDVRKGKFTHGIELLNASKNYFLAQNDFEMICESMNELGIAYFLQGDLETAESFFKASMNYGKDSPIETNYFLAEVNLAKVYYEKKQNAKAEYCLRHYIKSALSTKKYEATSNAFSLLGEIALSANNLKTAKKYFDKQLYYAKKSLNSAYISRAINNKAISLFYTNQPQKAIDYFMIVLNRRKKEQFPFNTYDAYFNLAMSYYPDKLEISFKYIDSCLQIAKENKLKRQELEIYNWRFEQYKDNYNKQLIDSMNLVIESMEKKNENIRRKIPLSKKNVEASFYSRYGVNLFLILLIGLLAVRFFKMANRKPLDNRLKN